MEAAKPLDTTAAEGYDRPRHAQTCAALFEPVYERYPERNTGIHAEGV